MWSKNLANTSHRDLLHLCSWWFCAVDGYVNGHSGAPPISRWVLCFHECNSHSGSTCRKTPHACSSAHFSLLVLIGRVAQVVGSLAYKAAATSLVAHWLAIRLVTVQWPWGRQVGHDLGAGCLDSGCGSVRAAALKQWCCYDSLGPRLAGRRDNEGRGWLVWGRSGPGTLEGVPAVGSRWAAEAPEAAPSPSLPLARGSPRLAGTWCAAAWLGRPPASSPPVPGERGRSSWSLEMNPEIHPGSGFPPWTSPAAPVKQGRPIIWHELTGQRTKRRDLTAGNCPNKLRSGKRLLISSGMFTHEPQRQCFTYCRLYVANGKHNVPLGKPFKPCDLSFSGYPGCGEMNVDFLYSKSRVCV